jgi:hypothetical protein
MKSACLLLLFLISINIAAMGACKCVQADPMETTHYGGNLAIVVQEVRTYRLMRGVILDQRDSGINNVLVEVFDHPEWLLLPYPQFKEAQLKQRRIAACKTGRNGRFRFAGLPDGKYELRASIEGGGWDVTHVYVMIDRNHRQGSKPRLSVEMHLGT